MSDSIATSTDSPQSNAFNKRALLFLIFFGLFSLFFNIGGRSLENKDYLKYAEVAREILEFDDWVMLHENGKIYVQVLMSSAASGWVRILMGSGHGA